MDTRKLLLPMVMVLASGVSVAQKTAGSISGQATDLSGAVVPNATVNLINHSPGLNRTGQTNPQG